jgi:hypothetical protein
MDDADVERLEGMFARTRDGNPPHEAVDIVAPRGTPLDAVEDVTIARLFTSNAAGLTIVNGRRSLRDAARHLRT